MSCDPVAEVCRALPVIIPAGPRYASTNDLLRMSDGFVFTVARSNVHPDEYGESETPEHGEFDRAPDAVTLPLIRALVERGQPLLGICRGFQEINVAMGGTLDPEIRDLPGHNKSMGRSSTPRELPATPRISSPSPFFTASERSGIYPTRFTRRPAESSALVPSVVVTSTRPRTTPRWVGLGTAG